MCINFSDITIVLVKPTNAVTYKTVADLVLIEKIDLTDLYNQSIILQRCAGLYGALIEYYQMKIV